MGVESGLGAVGCGGAVGHYPPPPPPPPPHGDTVPASITESEHKS